MIIIASPIIAFLYYFAKSRWRGGGVAALAWGHIAGPASPG